MGEKRRKELDIKQQAEKVLNWYKSKEGYKNAKEAVKKLNEKQRKRTIESRPTPTGSDVVITI